MLYPYENNSHLYLVTRKENQMEIIITKYITKFNWFSRKYGCKTRYYRREGKITHRKIDYDPKNDIYDTTDKHKNHYDSIIIGVNIM